jgi:hypothetical protein
MAPSVKAGLVGAAVGAALALLGLIPCLGCIAWLLALAIYVGVGFLTATWMDEPRDTGRAAGRGAVAGMIAALGWGVTNVVTSLVRSTVGGAQAAAMRAFRQLPPELRDQWGDLGLDPRMLARPGWAVGGSALCCGLVVLLAAALGAAGAAITVALQGEREIDV